MSSMSRNHPRSRCAPSPESRSRKIAGTGGAVGSSIPTFEPRDSNAARTLHRNPVPTVHNSGGTVLVAEDELGIRRFVGLILKQEHYSVLSAEDGPSALQLFERHSADISLVLLDLILPGLEGTELLRRFQQIRPGLPAILMTGSAAAADRAPHGCYLLRKPFTPGQLREALRKTLNRD